MSKRIALCAVYIFLPVSLLIHSCTEKAPRGDSAEITAQQKAAVGMGETLSVDTAGSKVRFTGHGVGKNHAGTFKLASGSVSVASNQITGGSFIINIKSMELDEKGGAFDSKLRPHLMSGDFFDAEKFGTAKFDVTSVAPYTASGDDSSLVDGANFLVSGNLTLKDVTKNVRFPAKIDLDNNTMQAQSNFDIDRREWQMNYGNDKTLGDKFISEKVNIELDIRAKR